MTGVAGLLAAFAVLGLTHAAPASAKDVAPSTGTWTAKARSSGITFTVRHARIASIVVIVDGGCGPGSSVQFKAGGGAIRPDGSFSVAVTGVKTLTFRGRFTTATKVSGTLRGVDRRVSGCDSGNRAFTGRAGAPAYAAGQRRGATEQGKALGFFVPAHRLTVGSLDHATLDRRFETTVIAPCSGGTATKIEQEVSLVKPLLIDRDGSFGGTQSLGRSTSVEVSGRLAADGTASGRLRVVVTGSFGRCDTGPLTWSAGRSRS